MVLKKIDVDRVEKMDFYSLLTVYEKVRHTEKLDRVDRAFLLLKLVEKGLDWSNVSEGYTRISTLRKMLF